MQQSVNLVDLETLKNEVLVANIGVDTAENKPSEVVFMGVLGEADNVSVAVAEHVREDFREIRPRDLKLNHHRSPQNSHRK